MKKVFMSNDKEMKKTDNKHCSECGTFAWVIIPIFYQNEPRNLCRKCLKRRLLSA